MEIDLSKEYNPQPKSFKVEKDPKPIKQIGKKGKEWIKDRAKLIKEAIAEGRITIIGNKPHGLCEDCGHYHYVDPDHKLKRSQGGSNDKSNIEWVCNSIPCMCHDKRDNQGDPLGKKVGGSTVMDKKIEEILIQIRFEGWERGKEQGITPYDYTLGDDEFLKGKFKELKSLIYDLTEDIIGQDEETTIEDKQPDTYWKSLKKEGRNDLREELRTKRDKELDNK